MWWVIVAVCTVQRVLCIRWNRLAAHLTDGVLVPAELHVVKLLVKGSVGNASLRTLPRSYDVRSETASCGDQRQGLLVRPFLVHRGSAHEHMVNLQTTNNTSSTSIDLSFSIPLL